MRGLVLGAALVGLAAAAVLWRPDLLPMEPFTARGLAGGLLVGVAGSMAGFLVVARNLGADQHRFLAAVFGGMVLRLGIFALALVGVLLRQGVSLPGFLFGLIPSYLVFQAAEMVVLHRAASAAGRIDSGGGRNG